MDEPFASVDAQTRADLEDLVLEVRERYSITTVFVTHDIDLPAPRDQVMTKELPEFAHPRAHVWRSIKRPEPLDSEALVCQAT